MDCIPGNPPLAFSDFAPGVAYQLPIRELIKSLHTLFVCAFLFYILLFPIYPAASVSPVHSKRVALPALVKGDGFGKGRGSLFPFLSFGSFSTWKRNVLLFFPWKRNVFSSSWKRSRFFPTPKAGNTVDTFFQSKMVLCAAKYTYPKMLFSDRVHFIQTFNLNRAA